MATISRQPGYAQGVNLTGAYAWLMIYHYTLRKITPLGNPSSSDVVGRLDAYAWLMIYHYTLRKITPLGNPSSSDVVGRLDKYLCVSTVKSLATMFTNCHSI